MKIQFVPTKDNYVVTVRSLTTKNNERLWWVLILFYLPMLFNYLIGVTSHSSWFPSVNAILVFFLLGIPPFLFFVNNIAANKVAAMVQNNPKLTMLNSWDIDTNEIRIDNSFGETKLSWETFAKVAENQGYYFLIYAVNKNMFQFVPKKIFEGKSNDEKDFRDLLQSKLGPFHLINIGSGYKISLYIISALYLVTIIALIYSNFH